MWQVIRIGNVKNDSLNLKIQPVFVDEKTGKETQKYQLHKDDILFTMTGTKGKRDYFYSVKVQTIEKKLLLNQRVGCLRLFTPYINVDFLCLSLKCQYILDAIFSTETGNVSQGNIGSESTLNLKIAIPPFAEQCRIVTEVNKWYMAIEQLEQEKDKLQSSIDQVKSKVLDLAIHGKLVPQDPNDEPAIELLKRINPKAEIITDNGHYQKLPEGWTICKLKDICSKLVDGDHNPPKGTKETTEYLMLSAQNIVNDNIVYTNGVRYLNHDAFETSDKRTKVMQGDLLITIVGTLGRSCVFSDNKKITLQRSVACLTPLIYNHFLKYYMDSSSIQKYMTTNAKGTAQKGFYLNQLEQLPIMIPPLTEQQRIVARIEKIFARLDVIESAL